MSKEADKACQELMSHARLTALNISQSMTGEEATELVRQFCASLLKDYPDLVKANPIEMGLNALAAAYLFIAAFEKAYHFSDRKVSAINAIKNAFEEDD